MCDIAQTKECLQLRHSGGPAIIFMYWLCLWTRQFVWPCHDRKLLESTKDAQSFIVILKLTSHTAHIRLSSLKKNPFQTRSSKLLRKQPRLVKQKPKCSSKLSRKQPRLVKQKPKCSSKLSRKQPRLVKQKLKCSSKLSRKQPRLVKQKPKCSSKLSRKQPRLVKQKPKCSSKLSRKQPRLLK